MRMSNKSHLLAALALASVQVAFGQGLIKPSAGGAGSGTVTSIATAAPVTGGTITNSGTISLSATDTISKGINYANLAAADSTGTPFVVDQSGMTLIAVRYFLSDTSHVTFNVSRVRSTTYANVFSGSQIITKGTGSVTPDQNTTLSIADAFVINISAITGAQVHAIIQLVFKKAQL